MQHRERPASLSHLSWDDLRFFLVCAESGSFRKAGKLLKVDSATIVRKITRLEAAIGLRLFNRLTDGVTLTDEGCSVAEHARAMERSAMSIERQSKISSVGIRGHVRVAVTEGLGTYWVLPRLLDFQKANRRLTFELQATMEHTDVGRLEADMSVQFLRPERPDLISVRLGHLHIYPFASFGYRELYGLPSSLEEARRHRFIQQVTPLLAPGIYERALGVETLEGIVGVATNSSSAVLYAVERDAGIGFLPTYALSLGAKLIPLNIGVSNSPRDLAHLSPRPAQFVPPYGGCGVAAAHLRPHALSLLCRKTHPPQRSRGYDGPKRRDKFRRGLRGGEPTKRSWRRLGRVGALTRLKARIGHFTFSRKGLYMACRRLRRLWR